MASKAHNFHDYSFGSARSRPRQVWYRHEEPVELPRRSIWRTGGGAIATAAAMVALVLGSAYAVTHQPAPPLAEQTPALPPLETWRPDETLTEAHVVNALNGPTLSVPHNVAPSIATGAAQDTPSTSPESRSSESPSFESRPSESPSFESRPSESRPSESPSFESRPSESREVIIDDSKMYPPTPTPYPNPTTTPPDAIAPPATGPATTPTPESDPENPYRD